MGNEQSVRVAELDLASGETSQLKRLLVQESMMEAAQQDGVLD